MSTLGAGRWHRIALGCICAAAIVLRVWGIDFGLPHTLARPDEDAVASVALRVFRRTLNPAFFDWPSLFMYVVAAGYGVYFNVGRFLGWFPYEATFVAAAATKPAPLFLIARALSATAGVLTVATVYRIGRILFDPATALLAAGLLAVAALHVRDSHFGLTDVAATWLLTMSLYTVRYVRTRRSRDLVISALWAGLAASTKYNVGIVMLPGVWAIVAHAHGRRDTSRSVRLVALYLCVAAGAFLAGTPYALLDSHAFLTSLRDVGAHLQGGHAALSGYAWRIHLTSSLRYGLGSPMLLAGISGIALYIWRDLRSGILFAMLPIAYFGLIGAGHTAFARHIIPAVPFLCLAAALCVVQAAAAVAARFSRVASATVLVAMSALVAIPSLWSAVQSDRLLSRTDSRLLAAQWIHDQFPAGATIYQSGATYGHVQMQTAGASSPGRYPELVFDEKSKGFYSADGVPASLPGLIVVPRCPLSYCDAPDTLDRVMIRYVTVGRIEGADGSDAGSAYDRDDAFFVPLSGFGGAVRPGPDIVIFGQRQSGDVESSPRADRTASRR